MKLAFLSSHDFFNGNYWSVSKGMAGIKFELH